MEKKYYIFSIILLLSLIISIVTSNDQITPVDQNTNPITTETSTNSTDYNSGNESDDVNDSNEVIVEETIYDNLVFSDGLEIIDIVEVDASYYAVGSKNGYPYLEPLKLVNNKLENEEKSLNFTLLTGSITQVMRKNYYLTTTIENNDSITNQDFFISNDRIIPFYKKQISLNYSKNVTMTPKYIVIHETNNTNVGADANAHYRYWNLNPDAKASTHFVVDNKQIYQMLELNQVAWHVGDNKGYSDITNLNSIGIEIAVNADGNYEQARQNTIELTIELMKTLNMDISQLKRHYDASGKLCPLRMIQTPSLWEDFVEQVRIGLES